MTKHKLLFVDEMTPDKMRGRVQDRGKIFYNMGVIDQRMHDAFVENLLDNKKGTVVLIAGRYICIITMSLDHDQLGMILINLDNNPNGAEEMASKFKGNVKVSEKIRMAFEAIKNTPDSYYDFELELGKLPGEE